MSARTERDSVALYYVALAFQGLALGLLIGSFWLAWVDDEWRRAFYALLYSLAVGHAADLLTRPKVRTP